jgi:hypothetical protein
MNVVGAIKPKHGEYMFTGPESLRMETASDFRRRTAFGVIEGGKTKAK